MKKRICCIAALTVTVSVALTGCADIPDLSDNDVEIISQYMAGAVLNSTDNYKYSFEYDQSVLMPTPKPTPTHMPTPTATPEAAGSTGGSGSSGGSSGSSGTLSANGAGNGSDSTIKVNFGEIYGISGINVKQTSYDVTKSLVTQYSSITADKGKKLIAVSFKIKNTSSKSRNVDLAGKEVTYSISIDGKSYGAPLLSIAEGDIQYFNSRIAAGKSKTGVLIFQVDLGTKIKDIVVKAVKGNKEADVYVK